LWALSKEVLGACIEVHRCLGPGLLESAYQVCLARELALRRVAFESQRPLAIHYKGVQLESAYRLDLVVNEQLLVELKCVAELLPIHEAQVLTYLKLANLPVGLLVNFNTVTLRRGVRRLVRDRSDPSRVITKNSPRPPPDLPNSL
jgi:GxxExxY protein